MKYLICVDVDGSSETCNEPETLFMKIILILLHKCTSLQWSSYSANICLLISIYLTANRMEMQAEQMLNSSFRIRGRRCNKEERLKIGTIAK